jgi:hypothetical protein
MGYNLHDVLRRVVVYYTRKHKCFSKLILTMIHLYEKISFWQEGMQSFSKVTLLACFILFVPT